MRKPVSAPSVMRTAGGRCSLLRNGHEITTAAGWFGPSRIRPVASNAPCVLRFINDPDRERYVAHLLRLPLETGRELCGLEIRAGDGYALLYYGVTIAR